MDTPEKAEQQKLAFISSAQTLDAVWRNYQEGWLRGTDDKRESREYVLSARIDDDSIYLGTYLPTSNRFEF